MRLLLTIMRAYRRVPPSPNGSPGTNVFILPKLQSIRQPLTDDTPLPAVASTQLVGVDRIAEWSSGVFVVLAVGASPRGWGFYP